jgi:hypothetical protein
MIIMIKNNIDKSIQSYYTSKNVLIIIQIQNDVLTNITIVYPQYF